MARPTSSSNHFILEAFDREQWHAVLQALFRVPELETLRVMLGQQTDDDPELRHTYLLDADELAAIVAEFGIRFEPGQLEARELAISLFRWHRNCATPYLIHTGYELPLLLDGRKKLARMSELYPPMTSEGEERFDYRVAQGMLHREEVLEPWDRPANGYSGLRTIYYTPKGEEWRIPAIKLISDAAAKSGGWNEYFERIEGMLFGYENWQNDWWIDVGLQGGGFGGVSLCCAVTSAGLAWIESAGFRALPPIDKPTLAIIGYDVTAEAEMHAFMLEDPDSAALVRFNVLGRDLMDFLDLRRGGPWHVPSRRIPELNRNLRRSVVIVARRDSPP